MLNQLTSAGSSRESDDNLKNNAITGNMFGDDFRFGTCLRSKGYIYTRLININMYA
jgi:hypothetical protein